MGLGLGRRQIVRVQFRTTHSENQMSTRKKAQRPNDQRSDVKNPNNPAHKQARDNRSDQKNPNHRPSKG